MSESPTDGLAPGSGWRATRSAIGGLDVLFVCGLLAIGVLGWQQSIEARQDRARVAFDADVERFLATAGHTLDTIADALELHVTLIADTNDRLATPTAGDLAARLARGEPHPALGEAGFAQVLPGDLAPMRMAEGAADSGAPRLGGAAPAGPRSRSRVDEVRGGRRTKDDLFVGPNARSSASLARDGGEAVLYVPDRPPDTDTPAEAWLYAPVYAIDTPWAVQDRRSQFVGLAFARIDLAGALREAVADAPALMIAARVGHAPVLDGIARNADGLPIDVRRTANREWLGQRFHFAFAPIAATGADATAAGRVWLWQAFVLVLAYLGIVIGRRRAAHRAGVLANTEAEERAARIGSLERRNADLESFAYVVSHDLKTPLRAMQALTEVLNEELADAPRASRHGEDDEIDECVRRLREQGERMSGLIDRIHDHSLTVSRDARVATIETRPCIESVAACLGIPGDRLQLRGDFPTIRTWPVRFEQTMGNLIGNAWKYHHEQANARLEVACEGFGDYSLFSVRDDGPGIPASEHERIFEVFEAIRVPGVESSGVGLSIVRDSVRSVGGRIWLESAPGHGSVFRFTWPKDIEARRDLAA